MKNEADRSSSISPYRVAIDLTSEVIARRARRFRNLVVTVVLVVGVCIVWAAVTWNLAPVAAFSLLLPVCGTFFLLDARLLNDWRSRLAGGWVRGDIALRSFLGAVSASPVLPKTTLMGMLSTLPSEGLPSSENHISTCTRQAVAEVLMGLYRYRADVLAVLAAGYAIMAISVTLSAVTKDWLPLLGVGLLLPLPLIRIALRQSRLTSAWRNMLPERQAEDFDPNQYVEMISSMDWSGIPNREKERFLAASPI